MNPSDLAIIAENAVLIVAIITGGHLFRQGGGWQFKTPPVPKAASQPQPAITTQMPKADENDSPIPFSRLG